MMKRLHDELGIPLEDLIQLDPVPWKKQPRGIDSPPSPKKRNGRPHKRQDDVSGEEPGHE
jgi:hypothetical protein